MANCVQAGLQTEFADLPEWRVVFRLLDNFFLGIFIFEVVARGGVTSYLGKEPCWSMFRDPWVIFDVTVIGISALEFWVLDKVELPFPVSVLRLVRLLKLAKILANLKCEPRVCRTVRAGVDDGAVFLHDGPLFPHLQGKPHKMGLQPSCPRASVYS